MRFSSATIRKERGDSLERTRINKIDIFFIAVVFHNRDAERISYTPRKNVSDSKKTQKNQFKSEKNVQKSPPKKIPF